MSRFDDAGLDPFGDFTFDDWALLPILTREAVQTNRDAMRSSWVSTSATHDDATGGSTGKPVRVTLGPEEIGWRRSGAEHSMRRLGIPQGSRRALLWVTTSTLCARTDGTRNF